MSNGANVITFLFKVVLSHNSMCCDFMTLAGPAKQSKNIKCARVLPVVCARIRNIFPSSKNETLSNVSYNLCRL